MKTSTLATLLSLSMAIGIAAPMFAADGDSAKGSAPVAAATTTTTTTKTTVTKATKPAKVHHVTATTIVDASTGKTGLDHAVQGGLVVTRVGGVGTALVLGTPVAIVRDTYKSYTTWTPQLADKIGGHEFAPAAALASIASVPASLVWGTVAGTYHGTHNAVVHGFNEPFNASSFSITKEYEE